LYGVTAASRAASCGAGGSKHRYTLHHI
jgi:hypothetical protein